MGRRFCGTCGGKTGPWEREEREKRKREGKLHTIGNTQREKLRTGLENSCSESSESNAQRFLGLG
jgi:transcriptional regulator NrdR family protein